MDKYAPQSAFNLSDNWCDADDGVPDVPKPAAGDVAILTAASGDCTVDEDSAVLGGLTMTGYTGLMAFGANTIEVAGDIAGPTGATTSGTGGIKQSGSGNLSWDNSGGKIPLLTIGAVSTFTATVRCNKIAGDGLIAGDEWLKITAIADNFWMFTGTCLNDVEIAHGANYTTGAAIILSGSALLNLYSGAHTLTADGNITIPGTLQISSYTNGNTAKLAMGAYSLDVRGVCYVGATSALDRSGDLDLGSGPHSLKSLQAGHASNQNNALNLATCKASFSGTFDGNNMTVTNTSAVVGRGTVQNVDCSGTAALTANNCSDGSGNSDVTFVDGVGGDLYVATTGHDANIGSLASPLGTPDGARDAIRNHGGPASGGTTVWVRAGVYERTTSLALTNGDDSGTEANPIVYRAYGTETVRIAGGTSLDPSAFEIVTSGNAGAGIWARIPAIARGSVYQCKLPAQGVGDFGTLKVRGFFDAWDNTAGLELFFNSEPMTLARWPNDDYVTLNTTNGTTTFTYTGTRPEGWTNADDVWFHGFWKYDYADWHVNADNINTGTKTVTLTDAVSGGIGAGQRYYAENLLEELDQAGEYYVDRTNGMLYFWPPDPIAGADIYVSMLESRLAFLEADYVTFRDIIFELGRYECVRIHTGDHIVLQGCTVRNTGGDAVYITEDATNSGLQDCTVKDAGEHGVVIRGGTRATLTNSGNHVRDCEIHDTGRWNFTSAPCIRIRDGCGHEIHGNALFNSPCEAIRYDTCNDCTIEENSIHDVCTETNDIGAIYTGDRWDSQGNVVRWNLIYDVQSNAGGSAVYGFYSDDCDSGDDVYSNIFYNVQDAAIKAGGGRDNLHTKNIIANCGGVVTADRRGVSIINNTPGDGQNQLENINDFSYDQDPWATAYPALAAIPNDYDQMVAANYREPGGCTFSNNLIYNNTVDYVENSFLGEGATPFAWWATAPADGGNSEADPLFVDVANDDYRVYDDSPAIALGFDATWLIVARADPEVPAETETTPSGGQTSYGDGVRQVTSPGTAVQASTASDPRRSLLLSAGRAGSANVGNVFVGTSDLAKSTSEILELTPGQIVTLRAPRGMQVDASDVYADADNANDGVNWFGMG